MSDKLKTYIEPLRSKHYSTRIVSGNIVVEVYDITPYESGVSVREFDINKWEPEFGYDHVESQEQYDTALAIYHMLKLKRK